MRSGYMKGKSKQLQRDLKELNMIFHQLDKYRNEGLLILRIGIGIMFMLHGFPKLTGGTEAWTKVGGALSALGINFAHTFMGFMAAISEFGGGLLLLLGLFTRPACFFLLCARWLSPRLCM